MGHQPERANSLSHPSPFLLQRRISQMKKMQVNSINGRFKVEVDAVQLHTEDQLQNKAEHKRAALRHLLIFPEE